MSSKKEKNIVARMNLARDARVLLGYSNVIFEGFIGTNKDPFYFVLLLV